MFTNLHRSHHFPKRATKPVMEGIRVAIAGNIERMHAQQGPANVKTVPAVGCEDTEVTGF